MTRVCGKMSDQERDKLMWQAIRQGILIILGAIERRWGFERSREPNHKQRGKAA